MLSKEEKHKIRLEALAELDKEEPDFDKVTRLYQQIENKHKIVKPNFKYDFPRNENDKRYSLDTIEKRDYLDLKLQGLSDKEIGRQMNVSHSRLTRYKKEWGIEYRYTFNGVDVELYDRLRRNGLTLDEICCIVKIDRKTLYNKRVAWGRVDDVTNYKNSGEKLT